MKVESLCIVVQKYILQQYFRLSLVLNLFLIFHQISGSYSYNIVLIKKSVINLSQDASYFEIETNLILTLLQKLPT